MPSVPVPYTAVAGAKASASAFNTGVKDVLNFLLNKPRCGVFQNTGGATSPGGTVQNYDAELYDSDNMHSTVSNTSRITINTPGRYSISAYANLAVVSQTTYTIQVRVNGSNILRTMPYGLAGGSPAAAQLHLNWLFVAGDYYEVLVGTNGSVTTSVNGLFANGTTCVWDGNS